MSRRSRSRSRKRGPSGPSRTVYLLIGVLVAVLVVTGTVLSAMAFTSVSLDRQSSIEVAGDSTGALSVTVHGPVTAGERTDLVTVTNKLAHDGVDITVALTDPDAGTLFNPDGTVSKDTEITFQGVDQGGSRTVQILANDGDQIEFTVTASNPAITATLTRTVAVSGACAVPSGFGSEVPYLVEHDPRTAPAGGGDDDDERDGAGGGPPQRLDGAIKFDIADDDDALGEEGITETDAFVIEASNVTGDEVTVTTKAGRDQGTSTLSSSAEPVTDSAGFKIDFVCRSESDDGDKFIFTVESVNNDHALSHVIFDFEDSATFDSPGEGETQIPRKTQQEDGGDGDDGDEEDKEEDEEEDDEKDEKDKKDKKDGKDKGDKEGEDEDDEGDDSGGKGDDKGPPEEAEAGSGNDGDGNGDDDDRGDENQEDEGDQNDEDGGDDEQEEGKEKEEKEEEKNQD